MLFYRYVFENGFHAVLQYYLIPNLQFYHHLHSAPFIHYPRWCFNNFTCLIAGLWTRLCNTSSWKDISSHGTYLGKESHTFLPYVTCLCHPDRYSSLELKALKRPNVKIKWVGIHFICYPCPVLAISIFYWIMLRQMVSLCICITTCKKAAEGMGRGQDRGKRSLGYQMNLNTE